ncbi:MAG: hypothetical protein OTI36_11540 [Beijerinckiaceae bacterium]|nr:hypothetical protein [Beijerinckiaceae bacterium]
MSPTLITKNLGPRRLFVLNNVRDPLGVLDLPIKGRANVEEREPSFAAKSVAGEDVGEDRSSAGLVRSTSHDRFVCCDHLLALT